MQRPSRRPELEPDPDALAHSIRLVGRIRQEIDAAGGWISFAQFMTRALYEPGLGYYSGGSTKFGGAGDFVTAPELSPLFGEAIAAQAAEILGRTGGDILELGPGTGRLAADLLRRLEELDALPDRYLMLDVSGELRARQRSRLTEAAPHLIDRIHWIDALPEPFDGLVLANEVLDAVPVHVVAWQSDGLFEHGVAWQGDRLAWAPRPLPEGPLRRTAEALPVEPPYVSEIGLGASALVATLAARLRRGALLFIDYGFPRREFYHPQRSAGTLMCHYRHHVHADPFHLPGLEDITAHVDFSAIADAACGAGADLAGYTSQAHFLVNCGITERLARTPASDPLAHLPRASGVQKLLSPAEMGELFKVIAFTRGVDDVLLGFSRGDLSRMLA